MSFFPATLHIKPLIRTRLLFSGLVDAWVPSSRLGRNCGLSTIGQTLAKVLDAAACVIRQGWLASRFVTRILPHYLSQAPLTSFPQRDNINKLIYDGLRTAPPADEPRFGLPLKSEALYDYFDGIVLHVIWPTCPTLT